MIKLFLLIASAVVLCAAPPQSGAAGGDLCGTYPNPVVCKVNTVAVSGTPAIGFVPTATGAHTATWQAPQASSGGTVTRVSGSGPTWLTWTIATPATTPVISLAPTTGQAPHQVIGTCGNATTFAPCTLTAADLPALNGGGTNNLCTDQPAPGAFSISGTTGARTYCLGAGTYTLGATLAVSGAKITIIGQGPATILQRSTAGDGMNVTGDDFTLTNLTYDGNSQTTGYALHISANRFHCQGVAFTGFAGNSGNGIVRIVSGAGHRWANCNWLDSPAEHNLILASDIANISDFIVTNSHFSSVSNTSGLSISQAGGNFIYDGAISNITWSGAGRCYYQASYARNVNISNYDCQLTGVSNSDVFGVWGCYSGTISNITGSDNNFYMNDRPFITFHDARNCILHGAAVKVLGAGSQCLQALDTDRSIVDDLTCWGGGGNVSNAANRGMVEFGVGGPGGTAAANTISNLHLEMPVAATNIGLLVAIGTGSANTADDIDIHDVRVLGTGGGTGIALSTANGASFSSPQIHGFNFFNLGKGISISSGVTNALIGFGQFRVVATQISNSGTNTIIK